MKTAVFIDIDHTLINGESQKLLAIYLFKQGKLNWFFVLRTLFWYFFYKLGITANRESVVARTKRSYKLVNGWKVSDFDELLDDFFVKELKSIISTRARETIQKHQNTGNEVILLSGSMDFFAKRLAKELDIKFYVANVLEEENGIYTGELKEPFIWGITKIDAAKKISAENNWDFKNSYVYTDHYSDITLLESVAHPNVVNPKREMIVEAKKRKWPILEWE